MHATYPPEHGDPLSYAIRHLSSDLVVLKTFKSKYYDPFNTPHRILALIKHHDPRETDKDWTPLDCPSGCFYRHNASIRLNYKQFNDSNSINDAYGLTLTFDNLLLYRLPSLALRKRGKGRRQTTATLNVCT